MFDLFTDIYTDRQNRLTRMDPRSKVLAAGATLASVLAAPGPILPMAICVVCVVTMLSIGVKLKMLAVRLLPALFMAAMAMALQMFFTGVTPMAVLPLPGVSLVITQEGWRMGAMTSARVMGATSALLLLGFTTPAHRIFAALRWMGVSESWVELAMNIYRHTFTLIDSASDMYCAQRVRLGYTGARQAATSAGVLAGSVLLRSFEQAERASEAMTARGYNGKTAMAPFPAYGKLDFAAAIGWAVVVLVALGVAWKVGA
ncbi:MAG: cobalt ECF transporter T component CbiQ [Nitrospinae bacterium]|nr:cobalt ECF transporter T component CbiQ [Nitrospinota bacterium]